MLSTETGETTDSLHFVYQNLVVGKYLNVDHCSSEAFLYLMN